MLVSDILDVASLKGGKQAFEIQGGLGLKLAISVLLILTVALSLAASACASQEPPIEDVTEANFRRLLTEGDFENALASKANLNENFTDFKELAASLDSRRVEETEHWYGLTYTTDDGDTSVTFIVMDFTSRDAAGDHFAQIRSGTAQFEPMAQPIGDISIEVTDNPEGIGPFVVFRKSDKVVQLLASQPLGAEPLITSAGLESLANLVAVKLK
ncbi:MAG: hypothetical protein ACRDIB_07080 [Ardenticatenaceae bacterium]